MAGPLTAQAGDRGRAPMSLMERRDARKALQRRRAAGEIDDEQYRRAVAEIDDRI